ncbi:ribose-phosphate pyrophosphokinase 2, chloroplastic-like isoform X2 [Triticum urartu]|uniref:ribose-phosphate pyrophosphokinase 2, chloroplastic-like isoform X2 n=1 Tax=Triticum urartu TaxID=4572 RepID=UPI0020446A4A|nr:ribose-phosphate pyrophosphokinase 2, chloroplastic-like isoform X2 [Triticum urartu]
MAATAAASPSSSLLLSRRHGASSSSSSASRAGASRLRAPRCVLGTAEQLRVVEAGKPVGGADPWAAAWTPKTPAQEARLAALPQEARDSRLKIFSGTANRPLAQEIASYLGVDLGKILIKRFADGEIYVQLQESVRGCDVFLVQPTCSPVNENLMELFIMIDACRRASARSITVVIPYFGYARADRKAQGREAITAKLAANLLTEAGSDRVIVCDMHSAQALGYFDIPVDHIYGQPVILDYLASKTISKDLVVVSPDVGGVVRARAFAKKLSDAPLAIVDKRRQGHNLSEVMHLIGDVKGKVAIMVDDMIDTAGTITSGAALLKQEGAEAVYACCTHAVLSPPAIERLSGGIFKEVIVTNSILLLEDKCFPQLTVLSMENLVVETIWHVHRDGSVSCMFQ